MGSQSSFTCTDLTFKLRETLGNSLNQYVDGSSLQCYKIMKQ